MILLSRYSWLGRYLWVARCCWSVSSWKSPSSAAEDMGRGGLGCCGGTLWLLAPRGCPRPQGRVTGPAGTRRPLHCSRWETSSAALLSLQGSRPAARSFLIWRVKRYLWRGTGACPGGAGLSREPGAGLSPEGSAAGGFLPRTSPCARPCFSPRGAGPRGHEGSMQPLQKAAAGHHHEQHAPPLKCPLVGFRVNIPLRFGGHLHVSGLMFCRSTVLVLFLVPVCSACCKTHEVTMSF